MSALYSFLGKSDEEVKKDADEAHRKAAEAKKEERSAEMTKAYSDTKPKHAEGGAVAFTDLLDKESLDHFSQVAHQPFSAQAVAFLNAYWVEVGDQAEFIFNCAYEVIRHADMHAKGVMYIHLYEEGSDLDFNIGLYFYEKLIKRVDEEDPRWKKDPAFAASLPEHMTAIARKSELREKVDVDFDGRISFLEYLLYQYRAVCNPGDFVTRDKKQKTETRETPQMAAARRALDDVNAAIRAYQSEKIRLEGLAEGTGVKALGAKNMLAQLLSGPLAEKLQAALIKAEAAVRLATKQAEEADRKAKTEGQPEQRTNPGGLFWMNSELNAKKSQFKSGM